MPAMLATQVAMWGRGAGGDLRGVRSLGQDPLPGGARAPKIQKQESEATVKVVHVIEEKVYAALGEEAEQASRLWVLYTGASNHMSGCRAAFSSIDRETVGTVKFTDGSVVKI
jgi:hypothetical protein